MKTGGRLRLFDITSAVAVRPLQAKVIITVKRLVKLLSLIQEKNCKKNYSAGVDKTPPMCYNKVVKKERGSYGKTKPRRKESCAESG